MARQAEDPKARINPALPLILIQIEFHVEIWPNRGGHMGGSSIVINSPRRGLAALPAAFSSAPRPSSATHRVSVQHPTFRTLLVALYWRDAKMLPQDRGQLGVAEFVNGAVVVDHRIDYLHGLSL
jgi:hypothetical protein